MFFAAFVLCIIRLINSKQKAKQHTENLTATLQTEIKILPSPGLFDSKQRSPGATLLGWPKSIYYVLLENIHIPTTPRGKFRIRSPSTPEFPPWCGGDVDIF